MTASPERSGAALLAASLERLGTKVIFAVPGTQTLEAHEALRPSPIRVVVPRHELAASFMAGGYARACGRPGVLLTIGGPGFTYALTGLAEAGFDSAPLLHIVCKAPRIVGRRFQVQAIDELAIAAPIVKRTFHVAAAGEMAGTLRAAHAECLAGEPGPVVVVVEGPALGELAVDADQVTTPAPATPPVDRARIADLARALAEAPRIAVIAGQGARGAAHAVRSLVERLQAPVLTTTSARGLLPEDHPLALATDVHGGALSVLNAWLASADLVLVLGAKLGDSGTAGFRLRLPEDRLIHIDASSEVLDANYRSRMAVHGDVGDCAQALLDALPTDRAAGGWPADDVAAVRRRLVEQREPAEAEPRIAGTPSETPEAFFGALRSWLPRETILTTDSGQHQFLARRYFRAFAPGGFMTPSGFQSMGFGIPAAIGARLAAPDRPVVALVGDGGLQMAGMELLTAVRERVPITVVVLSDGYLGLIRMQQIDAFGPTTDIELPELRLEEFARAAALNYVCVGADFQDSVAGVRFGGGVNLVEVPVRDSRGVYRLRASQAVKRALPPRVVQAVRRLLRRGR